MARRTKPPSPPIRGDRAFYSGGGITALRPGSRDRRYRSMITLRVGPGCHTVRVMVRVRGYPGRGGRPVGSYSRRAPSRRGSRLGSRGTLNYDVMPPIGTAPYGTLRRARGPRRYRGLGIVPLLGFAPLLAVLGFIGMMFVLVIIMVVGEHTGPSPAPASTHAPFPVTTPAPTLPTTPCYPFQATCVPGGP